MDWKDLPNKLRAYLLVVYTAAIPFAFLCFSSKGEYGSVWLLFTVASLFVATIGLRLPQVPSVVVSMGDVFTVLALIYFGPGPALVTYWVNVIATAVTSKVRQQGLRFLNTIVLHRLAFNLSCCTISIFSMNTGYVLASKFMPGTVSSLVLGLSSIALVWFVLNTSALSLAVSLASGDSFFRIWKEGMGLYVLNFFGSAAAAGLILQFYQRAGFSVFLLSLPLAVIIYQLYVFYIEKYQETRKHIAELNELYLQTIEALANAVDAKDRYTHGHIRRVQAYAVELAKSMGINKEVDLMAIRAGSLLHDIGKIAIPEYILNKPTVLTESEYEKMRIHPVVGANMLKNIDFPYPVIPLVRSHHERWDGKGYPEGLSGEQIPLSARILSLVDCYDALTTNRPYRSPMPRLQIIDLFQRESGRAYDPQVVATFIANLERMEMAGKAVSVADNDVWGIQELEQNSKGPRQLERVQPTVSYGKALSGTSNVQRELYSIFEFTRAEIQCLSMRDVFTFMASKLTNLIHFEAVVFYTANLAEGTVVAEHVAGSESQGLLGLSLGLEQKLTGWVAANNQALCNLPPFPDFLRCEEPRPTFQLSAVAPMNRNGTVVGAISLYRKDHEKFTEQEFRQLEIVASQTAIAVSKCHTGNDETLLLFDSITGIPNGFQLYLMFDQIAMDANKFEYPLALFSIHLDDLKEIRRQWGYLSGDESVRVAAKHLARELRETDVLARYAADEFVVLSPRMNEEQAEALKSRLQNELDHFRFPVRSDAEISIPASIGIAIFPGDGSNIETLLSIAERRMHEDRDLRAAVRRRIRHLSPSQSI